MATITEVAEAEAYVFGLIGSLASGRVYSGTAPEQAVYPLIIFQVLSGRDLMVVGAARVWTDIVLVTKCTDSQPSMSRIAALAESVDEALHATTGETPDTTALVPACVREEQHTAYPEENGVMYRQIINRYRLYVQAV